MARADGPALEANGRIGEPRVAATSAREVRLDERDEVGVRDLLLGIGKGDGLAIDAIEGFALELVAESGLAGSIEVVEVKPILDRENQTARTAVELVASALGKTIF